MGCKHNYIYTRGFHCCSKCGKGYAPPKSKKPFLAIPIIAGVLVGILFFYPVIGDQINAQAKTLDEINNIDEIIQLHELIESQKREISLMMSNGTDDQVIKDFEKDVIKNIKDLDKKIDVKKLDVEKVKKFKDEFGAEKNKQFILEQMKTDCHPSSVKAMKDFDWSNIGANEKDYRDIFIENCGIP